MKELKRCTVCHLPETYPGITFDAQGVCNLCKATHTAAPYRGMDALRKRVAQIVSTNKGADRKYDAAVAFSGGRDSTYLLYFAKEVLGLSVLAVTLTHDFMPKETLDSIERICQSLGVDLQVIPNAALDQCSTHCVQAWARKPDASTLVSFCTGCRYGIKRLIPAYCKEQGIPLLLVGNTRMEQMSYRQDLLSIDQSHPTSLNKMVGYLRNIAKNPAMLASPRCACVQVYEFGYPLARKIIKNKHVTVLAPFRDYLEVTDEERTHTLEMLNWQHNANFKSEWRADCYVNIIRQYFYQKILGFNDLDVQYADLLRSGKIDLPAALEKLEHDNHFDQQFIHDILQKHYALDLDEVLARLPQ